nr:hypothetical protein [Tanacetum cinerariifolium]
ISSIAFLVAWPGSVCSNNLRIFVLLLARASLVVTFPLPLAASVLCQGASQDCDLMCSGGGGTNSGSDGESGLDLLRDEDDWVWSDLAVLLRSSSDESSLEFSRYDDKHSKCSGTWCSSNKKTKKKYGTRCGHSVVTIQGFLSRDSRRSSCSHNHSKQCCFPETEDLNTYYFDSDDLLNAQAILMANISNYGSNIISEVPHSDTYLNDDMENQRLSVEQPFWFCKSNPTIESYNKPHVKVEVPIELPKVSLVNASLKKLKFHPAHFDSVVKKRTTSNDRIEGMFKLDLEPLDPRLLQNREAHIDYLKYTQEQADILQGIVKHAKAKQPLDNALDFTYSSTTSDSNTQVLSPTRLKYSTRNFRSKPTGNKKNDRISQIPNRNIKNKVEAQPRKVNKKNRVVKPIRDVNVKNSLSNANSELICATCNKIMFDGIHDLCLLDFEKNVNGRSMLGIIGLHKDAKTLFEAIQARFGDLEKIHEDDLEEMAVSFAEYEIKKVLPENKPRNQDSSRKTVIVEDTSSKAMVAIDGAGFDWCYMDDDEVPTNMAFMDFSDSEVHNSKPCSNTCLKSFKTLKTQYDNLRIEFNKSEFDLATYKRGLASVEEQLVFYKKNEVVFCDQIVVLKRDALFRDSEITALNLQIEKLKKEKESNHIKIHNFENAFKSLDKLIGTQITNNCKTGLGFTSYNAVAPPPTGLFSPPTIDLSNSGLEEFKQPKFEGYEPKASKSVSVDTSNEIKKALDAPITEDQVSDSNEDESEEMILNVQHKPEQANQPRNGLMLLSPQHAGFGDLKLKSKIMSPKTVDHTFVNVLAMLIQKANSSQHMTQNISYLTNFKEHDGGYVAFRGGAKGGTITGKGTIRADQLGKFDGKLDDAIFVGYSRTSKASRVYNIRTRKVEENLHITFLENKPMIAGGGPEWLFDLDALSKSMNYTPISAEANYNNLETVIPVSPSPSTRIHKDHPKEHIIREVEAIQEKLLHFKLLNVWTLVDLPPRKRAIGTKWVYRNKRDQRGIVVKNKSRLVAQGHKQEEGIYYDEVFAPVARIKAISQPQCFVDPEFPDRVYKVEKAYMVFIKLLEPDDIIFGSTKRSLSNEFEHLMHKIFQMSSMKELTFFLGLEVELRKDGIFLSQDKYVSDILKFSFLSVKSASTPMETHKPLSMDAARTNVDVHLYRSMIDSLMHLTSSNLDIMFAVCACSRFQDQPRVFHVGNKMHKAFPLSVKSSYCQKKFPLLVRKVPPTEYKRCHCQEDRTAIKDRDFRKDSYCRIIYKTPCPIKGVLSGNEATKKTKKNLLKQEYRNFKAEGSKTLEQTFNRLQAVVSHLQFIDIEIEQDDLNKKFLTSLAPEWLMHTIIWRNRIDLDMTTKHSSEKEDVNTASIPTTSTNVSPIDEDDMEEMDIKWNMALLSMRDDKFWKKTRKKISILRTDVVGFDKSKVECFNYHKMGHFARECRAPRSQDRGRRDNYRQGSKVEEQAPKALMEIDGVGWDWSFMANEEEDHALVDDEETLTEFALMAKTSVDSEDLSWTGLPEFADDTVIDYSRPSPAIESTSDDLQNINPSVTETGASPSNIVSKPFIKFVKATVSSTKNKADKVETVRKTTVKYAELYRKTSKNSNVDHGRTWAKNNNTHKSRTPRTVFTKLAGHQ